MNSPFTYEIESQSSNTLSNAHSPYSLDQLHLALIMMGNIALIIPTIPWPYLLCFNEIDEKYCQHFAWIWQKSDHEWSSKL